VSRSVQWYAQRLRRMSPEEVITRVGDRMRQVRWADRQVLPGHQVPAVGGLLAPRVLASPLPPSARAAVPPEAARRLVAAAERLLAGDWEVLGTPRPDVVDPDWFHDPVTGRRAPDTALAFGIDHRDEAVTGNVKSVWELSRHHHLTVLAAAWWLTGDTRYADVVAAQLRSWWRANPFLTGIHWTSGIELGVRLVSWVWIRRLLDDWPGVADLFEENTEALAQLRWHQEHLAAFHSRGSSANNHAVAESVGRLAAACAFPWFAESEGWRRDATRELERELDANTFPSGINRELATDYHRFVTELGLVALVESEAAGHPLDDATRSLLARSLDAAAGLLDAAGGPARQGDGDEGRALVLDAPDEDPWAVLLACGANTLGPCDWWPALSPGVMSTLLGAVTPVRPVTERPDAAPRGFADAGVHVLRTSASDGPEIWCRCDGGPHGFLSIAAHGHADALSIEVRHDGVELLVDPGTYCYHGEPEWRSYFRSTRAHNTVEVDGEDQAIEAGPFMWAQHADAVLDVAVAGPEGPQVWAAHHTAYSRLDAALCHDREVVLDATGGRLLVTDTLTSSRQHQQRMFWHLGPDVTAELVDGDAKLTWPGRDGTTHHGHLRLPIALEWSAHRGETDPPLGWYSPRFGTRVPTTTLVGVGGWTGTLTLRTELALPATVRPEPTPDADAASSTDAVDTAASAEVVGVAPSANSS
jgi:Heparinase II/III-like protein/Heparinase II/III N-terminus